MSASPQLAQVEGALGAASRMVKAELEAWRSGAGYEGVQDSPSYLPEVLTVVADTAGTTCSPGIQARQPHQPWVQFVAHGWAKTTPMRSQHLQVPRDHKVGRCAGRR